MSAGLGMDVTALSRTPSTIDVTDFAAIVTCQFTITASLEPVSAAGCEWASPSGLYTRSCSAPTPLSGTRTNGVWTCPTTINEDEEPGTWSLSRVWIQDAARARTGLTKAELVSGIPIAAADIEVEVTSPTQDRFGPSILSATFVPSYVNQSDGVIVSCQLEVFDAHGVRDATCVATSPSGAETVSCGTDEGTGTSWACDLPIPPGAELGQWTLRNVAARDHALNPTCIDYAGDAFEVGTGGTGGSAGTGGAGGAGGTGGTVTSCDGYAPAYSSSIDFPVATYDAGSSETNVDVVAYLRVDEAASDIVWGVSESSSIAGFGDFHASLRFYTNDLIEARYGGTYGCPDAPGATCPSYVPGVWYKVMMSINTATDTFSVSVGPCDEAQVTLLTNRPLRSAVSSVQYHGAISDYGSMSVSNFSWAGAPCVPFTCSDFAPFPAQCGSSYPDGCSGTVDCDTPNDGTCDTRSGGSAGDICAGGTCCTPDAIAVTCASPVECGDVTNNCGQIVDCDTYTGGCGTGTCSDNLCCVPLTQTQVCITTPEPDYECGYWPDGCGGQVNCDTGGQTCDERVPGEACQNGQCVTNAQPTPSNTGMSNPGIVDTWANRGYGSTTVTSNGALYENFSVGGLIIDGNNNTFRNCEVTGGYYGVRVNGTGNTIEDCEIYNSNVAVYIPGGGDGTTLRRVHLHDTASDSAKFDGNDLLVEYSLMEKSGKNGTCGGHIDLPQIGEASLVDNVVLRGNTIQGQICPCTGSGLGAYKSSNTVLLSTGPTKNYQHTNVIVEGNWINGSVGVMVNGCQTCTKAPKPILRNNRFGTYYNNGGVLFTSEFVSTGNVWDCDGSPIENGLPSCAVPYPGTCPGTSIY